MTAVRNSAIKGHFCSLLISNIFFILSFLIYLKLSHYSFTNIFHLFFSSENTTCLFYALVNRKRRISDLTIKACFLNLLSLKTHKIYIDALHRRV